MSGEEKTGEIMIWRLLTGENVIATEGDTSNKWQFPFALVVRGPQQLSLMPLVMASKVQTIEFNEDLVLFKYKPDDDFTRQYKRTVEAMKQDISGIKTPTAQEMANLNL